MHLAVDFLNCDGEHGLEGSDELLATLCHELLTLFHDVGWLDVVMVQGRNFNLDPLNAIAADVAHLGRTSQVLLAYIQRLGKFQTKQPLDLTLVLRLRWVHNDVVDAKRSERVAYSLLATVNTLHLFECNIFLRRLDLHGLVVARLLLSMRVVIGVGQQVSGGDRIPDADGLIKRRCHEKLSFLQVAYLNNRRIMSTELLEVGHVPRWTAREKLNHIPLQVPDVDFELARILGFVGDF